jgi:hypothetical protein
MGDVRAVKCEIRLQFPRSVFRGMGTFACIVFCQAAFQVICRASVVAGGILFTLEDVGVEHG